MKAKKYFAILLGCVLALSAVSCVEKAPEYVPGEPDIANGAYVLATDKSAGINPTTFTVASSDREFTYWLGRTTAEGACTVNIINHSDPIFTVPSSVSFAAGETKTPLVVTFSDALPEEDCKVSFEIDKASAAIYGNGAPDFTGALNCTPFHKLILGNYKSNTIVSYFGDEATFNFTVVPSKDDPTGKVIFENLEPYFLSKGYTANKGYNKPIGIIDEANSQIIIPSGQDVGIGQVFQGFSDADPDVAEYMDDIYVQFDGDKVLTFVNAWGITGWYTLYYGGFSCSK